MPPSLLLLSVFLCLLSTSTDPPPPPPNPPTRSCPPSFLSVIIDHYRLSLAHLLQTSGTLFLIVMPEFTARLKGKLATIGVFLLVILISAPIGALVIGAMYFEREMMEVPEQYKSTATWVRACAGCVAGAVLVFSWGLCLTGLPGVVLRKLLGATCWALLCWILSDNLVVEEKCTCQCLCD